MKHVISVLILLFLISSMACTPEELTPPGTDDSTKVDIEEYPIKIVWKTVMHPDSILSGSRLRPIQYRDKIIFSQVGKRANERILAYNKKSGEPEWQFEELSDMLSSYYTNPVIDNMLFLSHKRRLYNINLDNGSLNWVTPKKLPGNLDMEPRFCTYDNKIVIGAIPPVYPYSEYCKLLELDLYTSEIIDTVLTLHERPENPANIENVAYYKHSNGNDWLLFKNRAKVADFYAYDLTGDSVVWVNYDFNNGGGCILGEHHIYRDKVIFSAGTRMICYNIEDGSVAWIINRPSYKVTLIGDKIVCYNRDYEEDKIIDAPSFVAVYDAETGRRLWQTEVTDEAEFSDNFIVYKDKLYFSTYYLQCLDFNTGEKLWKFMPPDHDPWNMKDNSFAKAMVIDEETGYCYISDGVYAFCFDLNQVEY